MKQILALIVILAWDVSAQAITIDTVPVGNPGNAASSTGFGAVAYAYRIGTTEVSNAQYVAFLNAKAASDPLGLYNANMSIPNGGGGGITRSGASPHYTYSTVVGAGNYPANFVSWGNAIRFVNWLNNGQGDGDTETGAYTVATVVTSGTPRNPGATWFLPNDNEWYKAAFHMNDGVTGNYFRYPTSSNAIPLHQAPPGGNNSANYERNSLTDVGSYTQTKSPYGAFDMAGNVEEWSESLRLTFFRPRWGGSYLGSEGDFDSFYTPMGMNPNSTNWDVGFRVATIAVPEPSTVFLVIIAFAVLPTRRRKPTSRNCV